MVVRLRPLRLIASLAVFAALSMTPCAAQTGMHVSETRPPDQPAAAEHPAPHKCRHVTTNVRHAQGYVRERRLICE
jgi:hypothetical protein